MINISLGKLNEQNLIVSKLDYIRRKKVLYLMMLPGLFLLFVFKYLPIFGVAMAFQNFRIEDGIFGSEWVGFKNFEFFFLSSQGVNAIKNTIILNTMFLISNIVFQVSMALIFNEISKKLFKKITQTFILFPHFMSLMIVSTFVYNMMSYEFGSINSLLKSIGAAPVDFYLNARIWPLILTIINTWKGLGYGMIIYLAVLTNIEQQYYEAAMLDGANKWQQIKYISIPFLMPTIIILTLLAIGNIMHADFGLFYGIIGNNALLFPTTDVLDMYVYRSLVGNTNFGMSAAKSLFQSLVGFCFITFSIFVDI